MFASIPAVFMDPSAVYPCTKRTHTTGNRLFTYPARSASRFGKINGVLMIHSVNKSFYELLVKYLFRHLHKALLLGPRMEDKAFTIYTTLSIKAQNTLLL